MLLTASLVPALAQQQAPTAYFVVSMRNIAPDKTAEYLAFMNDAGKKFNQSRLASGEIRGWLHMRLTTPLVPTAGYNYVSVSMYDKAPELDRAPGEWDVHAKKAGFSSYAEYSAKGRTFGPTSRMELTRVRNRMGDAAVGDYVRVAQYSIPRDHLSERLAWLNEYAAPLNQQRIQAGGDLKGWGVSTLVLPAGSEAGYDYSTSVVLKTSSAVIGGPSSLSEADFKKAHPTKSYAAYIAANNRWQGLAKLERVRVYHVLDKLGALPQVSGR
ncbi:MAG: hypothetical protein HZB13_11065 [Acidobacteria bacterium]|nr:hypothetical protein [Acidobacteriota bacterium]